MLLYIRDKILSTVTTTQGRAGGDRNVDKPLLTGVQHDMPFKDIVPPATARAGASDPAGESNYFEVTTAAAD